MAPSTGAPAPAPGPVQGSLLGDAPAEPHPPNEPDEPPTRPPGRVVRVLPDVAAIDRAFDYVVPPKVDHLVVVGTMVRIELGGRRVGGWVVSDSVEPPDGVALRPLAKVRGWGPPVEVVRLARWAARRWVARTATFLTTASPEGAVTRLPAPAPLAPARAATATVADALGGGCTVVRLPPAADVAGWVADLVAAVAHTGDALVVAPSAEAARSLATALRRDGTAVALLPRDWARAAAGATVVGARSAVFAPVPRLAAVVVVDEHDEALQNEGSPTWHAREVAVERARRAGVPCVLLSPTPSLEALDAGRLVALPRAGERAGWPVLRVVDRRGDDAGRTGLWSEDLVPLLRAAERPVCVLNRTGRSRLLACRRCDELARCDECGAAVREAGDDGVLSCDRCGATRPTVCASCGSTALRNLRLGVSRAKEELEALLGRGVAEVAGPVGERPPRSGPVMGTEAALHRVGSADLVAFVDFDQELLAPRYRAAEEALHLLARAARLVGPRAGGGQVVVQTRLPDHDVIAAALHADPDRIVDGERARRRLLHLPPATHIAVLGGQAAPEFVRRLGEPVGVQVQGPDDGRWVARSADLTALLDALNAVDRPPGRLQLQVDPVRLR